MYALQPCSDFTSLPTTFDRSCEAAQQNLILGPHSQPKSFQHLRAWPGLATLLSATLLLTVRALDTAGGQLVEQLH